MGDHSGLTSTVARQLLLPPPGAALKSEEDCHSWLAPDLVLQQPLLRLWDKVSGSPPETDGCMRSRAPRERLDTAESRVKTLSRHIDNKIWIPTPYISFTIEPAAIKELAANRCLPKRGPHTLTAVHPGVRRMKGLPIIDVGAEMNHYGIQDPYSKSNRYYRDRYACLWEVTPAEIVHHWEWDRLSSSRDWFANTVMPAFDRFTKENIDSFTSFHLGPLESFKNLSRMLKRTPCLIEMLTEWKLTIPMKRLLKETWTAAGKIFHTTWG